MGEKSSGAGWTAGLEALNAEFWKALGQTPPGGAKLPFHEGLDLWARVFAGQHLRHDKVLDRVIDGSSQFLNLLQGMLGAAASGREGATAGLREAMEKAMGGFSAVENPVLDAMRLAAGEGARSLEQAMREWGQASAPLRQQLFGALDLPAFGYAREAQERQQALAKAALAYQEALARYNELMLRASRLGLERFESKLAERSEPGRQLRTARELYDLWVDAAEEGYAEVALSPEFRSAYGELVNAQMAVRQRVQAEVERSTASLGMPSRTELDAVHRKLAELRRRVAELEEARDASAPGPARDADAAAATPSRPAKGAKKPARRAAASAAPARKSAPGRDAAPASGNFAERLAAARGRTSSRTSKTTRGGR